MKHITLFANSIEKSSLCHSARCFGSAPFYVLTDEEQSILRDLDSPDRWLYYPDELSEELLKQGIESTIYCHSGIILKSNLENNK